MKLSIRQVSIGLAILMVLISIGYHFLVPKTLQQAPDITFKIVDGRSLDLKQLKGRPVLVAFWATSCESCVKEIPHLIELYQELAPGGLEIIAVAMAYDPPNRVMEMRQHKQIPYPIVLDIQGKIASAFGNIRFTPTTFLINPEGKVIIQKTGMINMLELRQKIHTMLPASTGG